MQHPLATQTRRRKQLQTVGTSILAALANLSTAERLHYSPPGSRQPHEAAAIRNAIRAVIHAHNTLHAGPKCNSTHSPSPSATPMTSPQPSNKSKSNSTPGQS